MTPIYAPGQKRWHCLMVPPQGERRAKAWLAARGVYGFYPVEELTRVRLGRQSTHERPYIPGYVFARFRGDPIWHAILGEQPDEAQRFRPVIRVFTGVIRSGDHPAWLHPDGLSPLRRMRSRAELLEARARRSMAIRKGDTVRIRDGAMAGWQGPCIDIRSTRGVVSLPLLGLEAVEIELDRLAKVA